MIKIIRQFFCCSIADSRDDEFIWALAEALLWRDEGVSAGAIPAPIRKQPDASRYYDAAKYLIQHVTSRWEQPAENYWNTGSDLDLTNAT